jgi:phosphoribosylformylglycinamidine synthase
MIVGLIEGKEKIITLPFKKPGNDIILVGQTKPELGGSEYHSVIHNIEGGIPPEVDDEEIKSNWDFLFELYEKNLVKSNHDVNKGGFLITIAEMCFGNDYGADLDFKDIELRDNREDKYIFSESAGRFILEIEPSYFKEIKNIAEKYNVKIHKVGKVIERPELILRNLANREYKLRISKMKSLFKSTIPDLMEI